jgi:hypothetical protein
MTKDDSELDALTRKAINEMVNQLETITYHKHHYVRKTGLKKAIKQAIPPLLEAEKLKAIGLTELGKYDGLTKSQIALLITYHKGCLAELEEKKQ